MSPLTSGLVKDSELLESNIVKRAAALFTIFDLNYVILIYYSKTIGIGKEV